MVKIKAFRFVRTFTVLLYSIQNRWLKHFAEYFIKFIKNNHKGNSLFLTQSISKIYQVFSKLLLLKLKNKISVKMEISNTDETKLIQEEMPVEKKLRHATLKVTEVLPKYKKRQRAASNESTTESRIDFSGDTASSNKSEAVNQIYPLDLSYKPKKHLAESFSKSNCSSKLSNDVSFQIHRNSTDNLSEISNINKSCKYIPKELMTQRKFIEPALFKRGSHRISNPKVSLKLHCSQEVEMHPVHSDEKLIPLESYFSGQEVTQIQIPTPFKKASAIQLYSSDQNWELENISKEERLGSEKGQSNMDIKHERIHNSSPLVVNTISSNPSPSDDQTNKFSKTDCTIFTKYPRLAVKTEKAKKYEKFYEEKSVKMLNSKTGINCFSESEPNFDFQKNSAQKIDYPQSLLKHNKNREKETKFIEANPPILVKYNEECTYESMKYAKHHPPVLEKYYEDHYPQEVVLCREYLPVLSQSDQVNEEGKHSISSLTGTSAAIHEEHRTDEYNLNSFVDKFQTSVTIDSKSIISYFPEETSFLSSFTLTQLHQPKLSSGMASTYSISASQNSSSKAEKLAEVVTWVNFKYNFNFEADARAICIRDINDRFLLDNSPTRSFRLKPYFTIIGNTNEGDDEEFCIEEILSILYYYRSEFLRNDPVLQGRSFTTVLPIVPISYHITSDHDYELIAHDLM